MKNSILPIIILFLVLTSFYSDSFKENQLKYSRVKQAYKEKEASFSDLLETNSISTSHLEIYLRAFKAEKKLELWAKNRPDNQFKFIKEYRICKTSGTKGPKRKQGDGQIPEGYYYITRFNPQSKFYLSLKINYPNPSDKILGVQGNLGGDIFIHGKCATIGCIPITDDKIKELYVFCVEAKENGQKKIPVTIFPTKLTPDNYASLQNKYSSNEDHLNLWEDLKKIYDHFEQTKQLPVFKFLDNGRHEIKAQVRNK
jgi:murein L,D-transpeptidase YafK